MNCNKLQFKSRRRLADEKSWRSQFMMRQHQFIHRKQTEQEYKDFLLVLLLSFCLYKVWAYPKVCLTSQMRCSHCIECSNFPLRTSHQSNEHFLFLLFRKGHRDDLKIALNADLALTRRDKISVAKCDPLTVNFTVSTDASNRHKRVVIYIKLDF